MAVMVDMDWVTDMDIILERDQPIQVIMEVMAMEDMDTEVMAMVLATDSMDK